MVAVGPAVYAGGDFTSIGGQPRGHLAALDATTGRPLDWNPGASADVRALAWGDSVLYVGGRFGVVPELGRPDHLALDVEDHHPVLLGSDRDGRDFTASRAGLRAYGFERVEPRAWMLFAPRWRCGGMHRASPTHECASIRVANLDLRRLRRRIDPHDQRHGRARYANLYPNDPGGVAFILRAC